MILGRRTTPRQITLPNGETFVARYERTSRWNLPRNVTVRRTRRIGPRKQRIRRTQLHRNITVGQTRIAQKGGRFLSSRLGELADLGMKFGAKKLFKKELDVSSRTITSEISKKLTDDRRKHALELYKIGTSKIKNKNLKKNLNLTLMTT